MAIFEKPDSTLFFGETVENMSLIFEILNISIFMNIPNTILLISQQPDAFSTLDSVSCMIVEEKGTDAMLSIIKYESKIILWVVKILYLGNSIQIWLLSH